MEKKTEKTEKPEPIAAITFERKGAEVEMHYDLRKDLGVSEAFIVIQGLNKLMSLLLDAVLTPKARVNEGKTSEPHQ